jgi:hypothetical protein
MYIYTMQAMPGYKAMFEGDTSVKYRIRRTHTSSASARHKSSTAVIRTDLGYAEATGMIKRFNDKERETLARKKEAASRLTPNA